MTIGPEPITRTLLMSSRLGIRGCAPRESKRWLAAVDSRAQEPGSGRRDTRRRVLPHPTVVEVDVAHLYPPESLAGVDHTVGRGIHRKTVVVTGDLDPTGGTVEHGLVDAVVSERQLVRTEPERPTEQLVAETNPKIGHTRPQSGPQQLHVRVGCRRVPRPVREEQRVRTECCEILRRCALRQHDDLKPALGKEGEG